MRPGRSAWEKQLRRSATRWRRLKFLRHTATWGLAVAASLLGLGLAVLAGGISSPSTAAGCVVVICLGSLVGWAISGLVALGSQPDRRWLSAELEQARPDLLDRVNTLVALESERDQPHREPLVRRIAAQAQRVLRGNDGPCGVSARPTLRRWLVFLLVSTLTWAFYVRYDPWTKLRVSRSPEPSAAPVEEEPSLSLPPPEDTLETRAGWGEVRITKPGRDLQVTKVDVVPLQIEAAADAALDRVEWLTSVNGQEEISHSLAPPTDPHFAVYQPMLYLDEFHLSDWDVLTYFARAVSVASNVFASEVFFLEVRPFREDIRKLPGGGGGGPQQCLDEILYLVGRQQHVIRQTHQFLHQPAELASLREQDRFKLADAEEELRKAADHLYARMAQEFGEQAIGEALDHLGRASGSLDEASRVLRDDQLDQAPALERQALADLTAVRKAFQRSVTEHPEDFERRPDEVVAEGGGGGDPLEEIVEYRNATQVARQFLQELAEQQQTLAERLPTRRAGLQPQHTVAQQVIRERLQGFRQEQPQVFQAAETEAGTAEQSLDRSVELLARRDPSAREQAAQAARDLERLAQKVERSSLTRQLTDAHRLRRLLEDQAATLGRAADADPGNDPGAGAVQEAARRSLGGLDQLTAVAGESPTRELFGDELREALSSLNRAELDAALRLLQRLDDAEGQRPFAGQAQAGLESVTRAFELSQRTPGRQGPGATDTETDLAEELGSAATQLESLAIQLEQARPVDPGDQARQFQEALSTLERVLEAGDQGAGQPLRAAVARRREQGEAPIELAEVRQLLDQLRRFIVELQSGRRESGEGPVLTDLDLDGLPAAYRGRIERYFRKLSETGP